MRPISPTEHGEGSSLPELTVPFTGSKDYTQVSPEENLKDLILEQTRAVPDHPPTSERDRELRKAAAFPMLSGAYGPHQHRNDGGK